MAARYDFVGPRLRIEEGANWQHTFTLQTGDPNGPVGDLVAVDLTNYTVIMKIRRWTGNDMGAGAVLLDVGASITLGGVAGTIVINVLPAATLDLDFDRGVYALELTDVDGGNIVTRELEGEVEYSRRINR